MQKMATKLSKDEMLVFGLCSTCDDHPNNPSNESHPKCKKNGCQIVKKMKCLILDYVQLLMISRAIQATKVAQNAKNGPQIVKK